MTGALRLAVVLALAAAPLRAQLVGHLPSESPFTDATGRHIVSGYIGYLSRVSDPAGVGPGGSLLLAAEYTYDFPSAFYLTSRIGFAPTSERRVLDPLFEEPNRTVGTKRDPLFLFDVGLAASLTGEKAWYGLVPRVFTNMGLVASTDPDYDIGQYRFGSKFSLSYGLNLRGASRGPWEWRAELARVHYRMNYPGTFASSGSPIDSSIIGNSRQNPWAGQTMLTIGIARVWGR